MERPSPCRGKGMLACHSLMRTTTGRHPSRLSFVCSLPPACSAGVRSYGRQALVPWGEVFWRWSRDTSPGKPRIVFAFFNNDATMDSEIDHLPSAVADARRLEEAVLKLATREGGQD